MGTPQFDYAKDNRSEEQYKKDFDKGTHNQSVAIEAYVSEKYYFSDDSWDYEPIVDKEFSNDWGLYQPDYILIYRGKRIPCEVKVQTVPLKEFVYLKKNQIDKLVPVNGMVLYATQRQYSMLPASEWQKQPVSISNPLNKPAYKMRVDNIKWSEWKYPPVTLK